MPNIKISSDSSLCFMVNESRLILDGGSGSITVQADIVNQEGYAHPKLKVTEMTSEEIQAEKNKADLKAFARTAFFVGSFIPCPAVQVVCALGSMALDAWDLKEDLDSGDRDAAIQDGIMIAVDGCAAVKAFKQLKCAGKICDAVKSTKVVQGVENMERAAETKAAKVLENFKGFAKESALGKKAIDLAAKGEEIAGKVKGGAANKVDRIIDKGKNMAEHFARQHPKAIEQVGKAREMVQNFPQDFAGKHPVANHLLIEGKNIARNAEQEAVKVVKAADKCAKTTGKVIGIGMGAVKIYEVRDAKYRGYLRERIDKMKE